MRANDLLQIRKRRYYSLRLVGLSEEKRLQASLEGPSLRQGQSWGSISYLIEECSQVHGLLIVILFCVKPA